MEEARQHPALGGQALALAVLFFGGSIALVGGVALQFIIGGHSISVGFGIFALTRAALAFWQVAGLGGFDWIYRSRVWAAVAALVWTAVAVIVSLPVWLGL